MAMKPQMAALVEKMASLGLPAIHTLAPPAAREQMLATVRARDVPVVEVGSIEDLTIPGPAGEIPVRIYRPDGGNEPGALVYYHGGGHVIGNIESHDAITRALCKESGCLVMSVDYRMGPEHKFPAAIEDGWAALNWLVDHAGDYGFPAEKIAVGGDSAGGNEALVMSLMAREQGGPDIAFQLLVYPVLCYGTRTPSYDAYGKGFGPLEEDTMAYFRDHYLNGPDDLKDWRASPRVAKDFKGLPKTLLFTAQCDVLNHEGLELAERLKADGVDVEHRDWQGMIHAFFGLAPMLDDAVEAQKLAGQRLRAALS